MYDGYENLPITIKEAVQRFIDAADDSDFDLVMECQKNRLDFLCANLEKTVIQGCDLDSNATLLEVCGSKEMDPKEAAYVIIKAIWSSIHSQ